MFNFFKKKNSEELSSKNSEDFVNVNIGEATIDIPKEQYIESLPEDELKAYFKKTIQALNAKQEELEKSYNIFSYEKYNIKEEENKIVFSNTTGESISFGIVTIGSLKKDDLTWLWDWAGKRDERAEDSSGVFKELYAKTGLPVFVAGIPINATTEMCYQLAATAIDHINAAGLYILPAGDTVWYIALSCIE